MKINKQLLWHIVSGSGKTWGRIRMIFLVLVTLGLVGYVTYRVAPISISINYKNPKALTRSLAQTQVAMKTKLAVNTKRAYGTVPESYLSGTTEQQVTELKRIKAAGFTQVRVGFNWSLIEATKGKYDWTNTDIWLASIHNAGLNPIIEIDRTPTWNRPDYCKTSPNCAPLDTGFYAKFAAAAVSRYNQKYSVAAWEIWNEQNSIQFWKPLPNPNQYAHLLIDTYPAIKKADPTAVVLLGGLSGDSPDEWGSSYMDPRTFLSQVYDGGAKNYFDAVGYHPYIKGFGLPGKDSINNGFDKLAHWDNNIRSIMVNHGDSAKGVWITEFGVSSSGKGGAVSDPSKPAPAGSDHVTAAAQAQITQAVLDNLQGYNWVNSFIWYNYKDEKDASNNQAHGYGIWSYDNQPKPVLSVLQAAIKQSSP